MEKFEPKKKKETTWRGEKKKLKINKKEWSGYTTHEGKDMNVISSHIHHFDSEENVWTRFKGDTRKESWDQK